MRGPEEGRDLLLGPRRLQWLKQFIEEFKDTEPDLTDALGQLALHRAAAQPYADLFDSAVRTFNGPRHDRKNQLLTFFFYGRFEDDSLAERKARFALDLYLKRDLPQSETLSEEVRSAIASEIHLKEARDLMRSDREESFFDRIFSPPEDATAIREHLLAAAKAAPANSPVYRTHAEWIRSQLKHDRLTKAKEKALEDEIEKIMRCWSAGAPEEVEPRLWLVNFHLDNDELDEARPHVDFLSAHRQDDPRVRALPWKWLLLDAMRLCRKKAGLAEASARLDEAEALWPAWLPKEWLSYLRAAWSLRARQPESWEEIRGRICAEAGRVRDSLADACLMLGAAQQLRIPAADLKPLRAAAELALRGAIKLPLGDLLDIGSVFWDLHRGQLSYPAYRAQANQIGATFKVLMKGAGSRVPAGIDHERFRKAVLWGSECGLWQSGVSRRFPDCFADKTLKGDPLFEAARLNSVLNRKYSSGVKQFQDLGPLLRDAARSQRDAFYHHWFSELANRLDDALARESAPIFGIDFGNPFAFSVPEDDDDDDTDGLSFDPDCDCPKCRAARKAREQASSSNGPFF
jgi:hypothetical protein